MIVLIEKNSNGKIEFTQEELETLLEKARQEGIREGTKQNYIYTTPSTPNLAPTLDPYRSPFTCSTEILLQAIPLQNLMVRLQLMVFNKAKSV